MAGCANFCQFDEIGLNRMHTLILQQRTGAHNAGSFWRAQLVMKSWLHSECFSHGSRIERDEKTKRPQVPVRLRSRLRSPLRAGFRLRSAGRWRTLESLRLRVPHPSRGLIARRVGEHESRGSIRCNGDVPAVDFLCGTLSVAIRSR
jgi:hypothetical protein